MKMFIIPTLEAMSQAMVRDLREKYYKFASDYSKVLAKHLTTETEVTIVNGNLSENDATTLEQLELEFEVLQYKEQIIALAAPWKDRLNGQPNLPRFSIILDKTVNKLIHEFELYIFKLQNAVTLEMRDKNQQLLKQSIKSRSMILNLTSSEIPPQLDRMLSSGSNFVPMTKLSQIELSDYVEKDLKNAAINFYRDMNWNS